MHITQVWAAYFSGTDTTKTIVTTIAQEIAQALGVPCAELNFTPPQAREQHYTFAPTDLVICGTPVIAGRVPNVLLPFLTHGFTGSHALAVPVVLFGNRNYDDALMELREILEADGLRTVAGGAFVGEHSFSTIKGGWGRLCGGTLLLHHFGRWPSGRVGFGQSERLCPGHRRESHPAGQPAHGAGSHQRLSPSAPLLHPQRPTREAHQHPEGHAQDPRHLHPLRSVCPGLSHGLH